MLFQYFNNISQGNDLENIMWVLIVDGRKGSIDRASGVLPHWEILRKDE
jgi:hypothetical protein